MLEKYSTWAFSYVLPQIKEIYNDDKYPRHYPNTMYPEYAAVTHSKIEVYHNLKPPILILTLQCPVVLIPHNLFMFTLYYLGWHRFIN